MTIKPTVSTASAPAATPADEPVARRTFRQELGDLIKVMLFCIAVYGAVVALSVHRYAS